MCFSSCGHLNSEIDVNQWRIESPSRLSKVHVSIPRNAVFRVKTITRATRNFQMKLIHRFNRPISARNFPQFPGNVPFCPRSLVPPIGPDRLRHGWYAYRSSTSSFRRKIYIAKLRVIGGEMEDREGRKCIFIFNVNGRARMRVTCRVQSMRATRVTGRVGELNKE